MKAIAVNGRSKSGKTTVCETIIKGLRQRGYTVGSVKEIHFEAFSIDPDPRTNTNRHRSAGSQLVTARGLGETDILYQSMLPMDAILKHYTHDYVVLEGVTDLNVPRILTAHRVNEVQEQRDGRAIAVSGVISNRESGEILGLPVLHALENPQALVDFVEERAFEPLPSFDPQCCAECGHSCRELAGMIAWQRARREDCVLWSQETELLVNGVPITMVPIVQDILKDSILGVVRHLRGFEENSTIEIRLRT